MNKSVDDADEGELKHLGRHLRQVTENKQERIKGK